MKARNFFGIALIALAVGIWQVAAHQHQAGQLAAAIGTQDAAGLDTTAAQQALASYTAAHMATARSVTLTASYNRATQAAQAAANPSSNGQVYAAAQAACASHADSLVQANCVQAYLQAHSTASANPQAVATPTTAAYTKIYRSPGWTADSAGLAFLVSLAALALSAYLVVVRQW